MATASPAAEDTGLRHVFVYGTLRRGQANDINRLMPPPCYVGMATVDGVLHDLGPNPGLRLGGQGRVLGEVYAIAPGLERLLDEIEEIFSQQKDEYFKREQCVTVDGRPLACLVYEINPRYAEGRPVIESGDWVRGRQDVPS